ncbi:FecR family protein [Sphingobium cloacae]|uniref:Anti-FecI sigma factor FecR n=1 Tax=Sphingobium cloacae TaxID=120107 RepID=A0A1E1F566_9SPHN|nr:FecR family protein [Sphingobium cloacae]BAV65656.1 hypothetical protein SCLO_1026160 [Sphingobium cloacae]
MDRGIEGYPPISFERGAEEQAVIWAIALHERPADEVLQQHFQTWLEANAAHHLAWAEMRHIHDRLGEIEPTYAVRTGQARRPWPATRAERITASSRHWRGAALLAGCALCLGLLFMPAAMLRLQADHRTGVAEIQRITLADGSVVQLAPRSAIAVDYAEGRRDIRLLKGEAFFTVTPDPQRPFRVRGARATVTVLGTAFDVREAEAAAQPAFIGVEHGRVRVEPADGPADILTGGEAAIVAASGRVNRQIVPATQVAAWRERQLIVQDESIADAIERLRPWFNGMIVARGDALARQRLTGVFNASDPLEALHGMARAYGGRVMTIGGWLVIYSQD